MHPELRFQSEVLCGECGSRECRYASVRALWTTDRLRGGKNAIVRVAAGPIMDGKWNRDVPKNDMVKQN